MIYDEVIKQKFKDFEQLFFSKIYQSGYKNLLTHKLELKRLLSESVDNVLIDKSSKANYISKALQAANLKNELEKKHIGIELHNGLEQNLTAVNFYVDALLLCQQNKKQIDVRFLSEVKKLSQSALVLSGDISSSLMSNQLSEVGLVDSLKEYYLQQALKNKLSIDTLFESNFNENRLEIFKKHAVYKVSRAMLNYILSYNLADRVKIKYAFKYNNILQIEFTQTGLNYNLADLYNFPFTGYNNLKHKLELLMASVSKKIIKDKAVAFIIKIPIHNNL